MSGDFDPRDDFERSLAWCYQAIRSRIASGGRRWMPKESVGSLLKAFDEIDKMKASHRQRYGEDR